MIVMNSSHLDPLTLTFSKVQFELRLHHIAIDHCFFSQKADHLTLLLMCDTSVVKQKRSPIGQLL